MAEFQSPLSPVGTKNRIEYIDAMRGFTMILVVYSHVICHTLGIGFNSDINNIFIRFRMPLFFFISGFMAYSCSLSNDVFKKKFMNRLTGQLFPTIVMFVIFSLTFDKNLFNGVFIDSTKRGYWFTFVLFEIFSIYILLHYLLKDKVKKRGLCICFIAVVLAFFVTKKLIIKGELTVVQRFFSLEQLFIYLPYFFVGVICKMYYDKFISMIKNGYVMSLMVLVFVAIILLKDPFGTLQLSRILGVFIVYRIFYQYRNLFNYNTWIGKLLSYIGKNTIQVYFLHYFFIEGLRQTQFAKSVNGFIDNNIVEFIVVLAISFLITMFTLFISETIKAFPPLNSLMFGFKRK